MKPHLLILLLLLTACAIDLQPDPFRPITFRPGNHRPVAPSLLQPVNKPDKIEISVLFTTESRYTLSEAFQPNWNKITGLAFAREQAVFQFPEIHAESVRLAWRYWQGRFEIGRYTYVRGVREYSVIDTVPEYEPRRYRIEISRARQQYIYSVLDSDTRQYRELYRQVFFHRGIVAALCHPYFGGSQAAPAEVTFFTKDLLVR